MNVPIYEIVIEAGFSASHQLTGYQGEIETLHGHNFRVEASLVNDGLDEIGVVMDFLELEAELKEILSPFDHRHLNEVAPFDELNPSAENIARLIFEKLVEKLSPRVLQVHRVRVWETPMFSASYGMP